MDVRQRQASHHPWSASAWDEEKAFLSTLGRRAPSTDICGDFARDLRARGVLIGDEPRSWSPCLALGRDDEIVLTFRRIAHVRYNDDAIALQQVACKQFASADTPTLRAHVRMLMAAWQFLLGRADLAAEHAELAAKFDPSLNAFAILLVLTRSGLPSCPREALA